MTHYQPISSGPTPHGADRVGAASGAKPQSPTNPAAGAAFQALIDELEAQARQLAADSQQIAGPTELAEAVDRAHASLADALSLSDRLLEAYRASLHAPDAPSKNS